MNRNKLSSQLLNVIDIGSDPGAIFRVRIDRTLGKNFASHCLLGVNGNQIVDANITITADLVIEQIVFVSTDDAVTFISMFVESSPPVKPSPPEVGC